MNKMNPKSPLPISIPCRVAIVFEEFVRMLHACGMPPEDADILHGLGPVVNEALVRGALCMLCMVCLPCMVCTPCQSFP